MAQTECATSSRPSELFTANLHRNASWSVHCSTAHAWCMYVTNNVLHTYVYNAWSVLWCCADRVDCTAKGLELLNSHLLLVLSSRWQVLSTNTISPATSKYTQDFQASFWQIRWRMLAYCLWPDTLLYHSDAETENRLPKLSSVNDSSIGFYSDRIHVVQIAFLTLTSQLFSHLWSPKLFEDVMSLYTAVNGELHADD